MKRPNLIPSALFTVVLVTGFAWYGEQTGAAAPQPAPRDPDLTTRPLPPIVTDPADPVATAEQPPHPAVEPVRLPDAPPPSRPDHPFTQPVEPPPLPGATDTRAVPPDAMAFVPVQAVFNPSDLDQMPVPSYQARPDYPGRLKADGVTGEVLVDFIVDPAGNVRHAFAVRATRPEFADAACEAVGRWTFKPGRKRGAAVSVHMQVPIVFSLDAAAP